MSSAQSSKNNKALRISGVLAMVAVGHLVSAWLIGNMKMPEIRPLELTKPLEVKMIHIEKPKPIVPPPPKPKPQPPKPKEQPKPQPPKKVVEKPKPVVQPPKPVPQRVIQTKTPSPKPQQTAPDVPVNPQPQPVVVQDVPPTPKPQPVVPETPPSSKTPTVPETPQPVVPKTPAPVTLSANQIKWKFKPVIREEIFKEHLNKAKLDKVTLIVSCQTDAQGKMVSATVTQSSGIPALDDYVQRSVMRAKIKEYKVNGVPTPAKFTQPYTLSVSKSR